MAHPAPTGGTPRRYSRPANPICPACKHRTHPLARSARTGTLTCTHCIKAEEAADE